MRPPPGGASAATVPGLAERVPPGVALAAITGLALALRLWGLGSDSLWVDEGYSLQVARLGIGDIPAELAAHDTHPPLHYVLLHGWVAAFGESEWALRSLSAVLGVLLVPVVFRIGSLLRDRHVGLLAAVFVAVSPLHVRFSQEARMYALLALLTGVSFLLLARLLERRTRGWAAVYVVAAALLLYSHVWGLFVLLAQAAAVALDLHARRPGARRGEAVAWVGIFGAALALYAPWLVVIVRQTAEEVRGESANLDWISTPTLGSVADTARLWLGPAALAVIALMALAAAALRASGGIRDLGVRDALGRALDDRGVRVLALWLAVPLAVPLALSFALPIYRPRYTIAPSVALSLLLAIWVLRIRRPRSRLLAGSALVLSLAAATAAYHATYEKEDWRGLARHVDASAQPGDLVLFAFPLVDSVLGYYSQRADIVVRRYEEGAAARAGRRVWFIRWTDQPPVLPAELTGRYGVRETRTYTGDLELSLLERRP